MSLKHTDKIYRAFSSAGLEHLPYKQRVGGSNPSTPTGVFPRGFLFGEAAGIFLFIHFFISHTVGGTVSEPYHSSSIFRQICTFKSAFN